MFRVWEITVVDEVYLTNILAQDMLTYEQLSYVLTIMNRLGDEDYAQVGGEEFRTALTDFKDQYFTHINAGYELSKFMFKLEQADDRPTKSDNDAGDFNNSGSYPENFIPDFSDSD